MIRFLNHESKAYPTMAPRQTTSRIRLLSRRTTLQLTISGIFWGRNPILAASPPTFLPLRGVHD